MAGLKLDLSPGGDGAGNQDSIEAFSAAQSNDTYMATRTMVPLFRQIGGDSPAGSAIAYGRSSEPSLSEMRLQFLYRSLSMGFGLEGVNNSAGNATRQDVARRALDWLLDTLTVSVEPTSTLQFGRPVTLKATASSSVGARIEQYRWDFGDGSPIVTTTSPTVEHRFGLGSNEVKVEVTDALGHRAVASMQVRRGR